MIYSEQSNVQGRVHDAIVIGAGPAGSVAALLMARDGLDVVVVDKGKSPGQRVGESFMPRALQILRELGLEAEMRALPHIRKFGGEFVLGHENHGFIARFQRAWPLGELEAFNLERAPFDAMVCGAAIAAGADVCQGIAVTGIERLADGDVAVGTEAGTLRARWLVDCSGQGTVLGRHLETRTVAQGLDRVAYYTIAEGVTRKHYPDDGAVIGVIHEEGWFWVIPLDSHRTSIGAVLRRDLAGKAGVKADRMLRWAIARSPQMAARCRDAVLPETNEVIANFTYSCSPWAGPGYFMAGDAATFLDPIFSTGVTLGMESGRHVARLICDLVCGRTSPEIARREYVSRIQDVTRTFFGLVSAFYDPSFRELFLSDRNPLGVRRAILTLLSGYAFEAPFFLRWRLGLLYVFVWFNRLIPLVGRSPAPSLLGARVHPFGPGAAGDPPVPLSNDRAAIRLGVGGQISSIVADLLRGSGGSRSRDIR
jgi:flavin-dependent dehydrogenase